MKKIKKDLRKQFVEKFGEETAVALENAARFHSPRPEEEKTASDPFAWAIVWCIGFQCFEVENYRSHHGIPKKATFSAIRKWIRDYADLGHYKGDIDYLSLMTGAYQPFIISS